MPPQLLLFIMHSQDVILPPPLSGRGKQRSSLPPNIICTLLMKPKRSLTQKQSWGYEAPGVRCLAALYGADDTSTLRGLRYELFVESVIGAKVDLTRLPLTEDSAKCHTSIISKADPASIFWWRFYRAVARKVVLGPDHAEKQDSSALLVLQRWTRCTNQQITELDFEDKAM